MNAVTFNIPDEVRERIDKIAEDKGVTVEALLSEMTADAVREFEARQAFLEIARQGESEVEAALELLRR